MTPSETFLTSIIATLELAQNDITLVRALAILCSLTAQMTGSHILDDPANAAGLTLAQANISAAHTYFSSIDTPDPPLLP